METHSDDMSGLSAASLAGAAIQQQRGLHEALDAVQKAAAAETRGQDAIYGETVPAYEERQTRLAGARREAEAEARRLERTSWETVQAIRSRIGGAGGLGLTPSEWQQAGNLARLAETLVATAVLGDAIAVLRSAAGAKDRPRMAALATASEARLRTPRAGDEPDVANELRTLVGEVKHELRDSTFDGVRQEIQELLEARGELGMAMARIEGGRPTQGARGVTVPVR
jgi:hypothetical protein